MKIVRMKIQRTFANGVTSYTYPQPHYDKTKVRFLQYEAGAKARGENYQFIIVGVKAADLAGFLAADGVVKDGFTFESKEITRDQAIVDGEKWVKQVEKITDPQAVLAVTAKAALGTPLTKAEKDILDPDNPAKGVNKTATFTQSLDAHLNNPKND